MEPRQNGKGGILEARELAGLFLFGEELITHTAHRFDTSVEAFRRIRDLIEATPDLSRRVHRIRESHGEEGIELFNPIQRLNFKARSKGSGRGFSGDVVILDEAFWLLDLGSLMPTMSARPNPQLWYTSSAPQPRAESDILRNLCRRARKAARGEMTIPRLAYFEWSAPDDAPPDDPAAWAQANPGLGYRILPEFIQSELGAMAPDEFARERLGIFVEELGAVETVLDAADWKACEAPHSSALDPVALAFEVSNDRKWGVIAAAGISDLGGTHVEVIDNRQGTSWMVERLLELRETHHPSSVACNPSGPAGALLRECERAGLDLDETSSADYAKACGAAYDAVAEHRWRHLIQPELNMAVGAATKRVTGDSFVFDRRAGRDISPLVAVTLAAWAHGKAMEEAKPIPHVW